MDKTGNLTLAGLFIGLGVMGAGYFASKSLREIKLANQKITVKGYAQKDVLSDMAKWTGTITEQGISRQETYGKIQASKAKLIAFLDSKGIDKDVIGVSPIRMYPTFEVNEKGQQTGKVLYYTGDVFVDVQSNDVSLISSVAKDSEDLINQGLGFTSGQPMYLFSKLDDVKIELLGEAAKDAKARAEEITSQVDSDIGAVKSAQQGVFQITARNDTSVSSYGMYDTSSMEKTVKAVVTVSFATDD